jgi:predicted PolB exonuclease-like 3'-5' exonuclease
MICKLTLENILFLDIETVPITGEYKDLEKKGKELWERKSSYFREGNLTAEEVYQRAGIFAEFGKIIVISCGYFTRSDQLGRVFRVKSFYGEDERQVLVDFSRLLNEFSAFILCAHNGKEFDFPFLARRILINRIKLPKQLDNHGKKPWEVSHLDTMELWKFGDYKNFTSLNTLAYAFGLPSSKDDMDGNQVSKVFYEEKQLERIKKYCERDMVTVARVFQCMRNEEPLKENEIEWVN